MPLIVKLIISLAIPLAIGAIGSFFTISQIPEWYASLDKSYINPPNWLFGPVWTTLYIMMGVALFLVWRTSPSDKDTKRTQATRHVADEYSLPTNHKKAYIFFGIQMTLNLAWSLIFFGAHLIDLALIEILILGVAIAFTIKHFHPISKPAAWLLAPYLAWVCFATILNFSIVLLN